MATTEKESNQSLKRPAEEESTDVSAKKKAKTNTIPIVRGKFKGRWLAKHATLLKRSDSACGVLVSSNIHSETRALGQVQRLLDTYAPILFPDHTVTWERYTGELDVPDLDAEEAEEEEENMNKDKKDKRFQAVDAACAGLIFYRFRINVRPTAFIARLMEHLAQLPNLEQELRTIRHCARWIPLDYICPATTDRMKPCFERMSQEQLVNQDEGKTVAIVTEVRNQISLNKESIIQLIAPLIPPKFKVDLKKPDLVIFVTVFKSVCGMSVLPQYYERKKYNMVAFLKDK